MSDNWNKRVECTCRFKWLQQTVPKGYYTQMQWVAAHSKTHLKRKGTKNLAYPAASNEYF